ncbi:MAG: protein-L-isoaspartate O-methyltransferase [Cohaesibacter sp.]|nr:protein-L-isoaspartate O-methyltransferase [Cohaesibacter sp.]
MGEYADARRQMVDNQIRTTDVTAYHVLKAFESVPRELFVPSHMRNLAYSDVDIALTDMRCMMQPSPLAKLLQLAEITADDLVLVVGAQSGYTAALISKMANTVVAVESDDALVEQAQEILTNLSYDNVAMIGGDITKGYASEGPYDVIVVEGAVEDIPRDLLNQLKDGGALVAIDGKERRAEAIKILRQGDNFSTIAAFDTNAPALAEFAKPEEFAF